VASVYRVSSTYRVFQLCVDNRCVDPTQRAQRTRRKIAVRHVGTLRIGGGFSRCLNQSHNGMKTILTFTAREVMVPFRCDVHGCMSEFLEAVEAGGVTRLGDDMLGSLCGSSTPSRALLLLSASSAARRRRMRSRPARPPVVAFRRPGPSRSSRSGRFGCLRGLWPRETAPDSNSPLVGSSSTLGPSQSQLFLMRSISPARCFVQ